MSMALPERRVRVILSVLEAMGVAEEVKAARWKGVEPKPTREQIDKAAMVFEARRISDRRRLSSLLSYMNTQKCRVQMMRSYFGEPEGDKCGLCDSCAGLDSEVFDPGDADERHGLHAATDFHARPRRRRRGRPGYEAPAGMPASGFSAPPPPPPPPPPPAFVFETAIPTDLLPPLEAMAVPVPPDSENSVDDSLWNGADGIGGEPLVGDVVLEAGALEDVTGSTADLSAEPAPDASLALAPDGAPDDFDGRWASVRDANIRPYVDWRPGAPVVLPVLTARPAQGGGGGPQPHGGPPQHGRRPGFGKNGSQPDRDDGGRRGRRRRGRNNRQGPRDHHRPRDRDRGPRLPGFYNPGGD